MLDFEGSKTSYHQNQSSLPILDMSTNLVNGYSLSSQIEEPLALKHEMGGKSQAFNH